MKRISSLAALVLILPMNQLSAQDDDTWSREIELGALFASGNTQEQSLNFAAAISLLKDDWEYAFTLDGLYTSSDDVVKGQRVYAVGQADYEMTEFSYLQVRVSHEDDRFSGFDSQSDLTFSYGRELLRNRPNMTLDADVGVGARYSKLETGETATEPIVRLAGEYDWTLSETALFTQELSLEKGSDSDIYRSLTAIETDIMENLSLRLSFKVKHQTEVPVGKKNTDTETAVSFVMSF